MIKLRNLIREDGYGRPERKPIGTTNGDYDLDTISTLGTGELDTSKGDVSLYEPEVDSESVWDLLKQRYPNHKTKQQLEKQFQTYAQDAARKTGGNELAYKQFITKAKQSQDPLLQKLYHQIAQYIKPVGKHLNDFEDIQDFHIADQGNEPTSGLENWQRMAHRAEKNNKRAWTVGDDVMRDTAYGEIQGMKDAVED